MAWQNPSCGGGQNFEDKHRSTFFLQRRLVECCSVSSCELCVMPACESKLVSRSSKKATVAKTVFVE